MGKRFADRVVLITGAAGGMGRAFALKFAAEGAGLILTDVEQQGLEETATLVRAQGGKARLTAWIWLRSRISCSSPRRCAARIPDSMF